MRIGAQIDVGLPLADVVAQVQGYAESGFDSAWAVQIFGYDALTLLAVVGTRVPGIELGTGVVPVYSRLPQVMAQQALTVQAATGGRLVLGIGLSHQVVVEGLWGLSYERPARYLREYLSALIPLVSGGVAGLHGEVVTAVTYAPLEIPGTHPPPVLVAALGPTMLDLAGRVADGTVTWMTGIRTVADHIVPCITAGAAAGGRRGAPGGGGAPGVGDGRRRTVEGSGGRGVRHLPDAPVLPGHARPGGCRTALRRRPDRLRGGRPGRAGPGGRGRGHRLRRRVQRSGGGPPAHHRPLGVAGPLLNAQRGIEVCLNSLISGRSAISCSTASTVERANAPSPCGRVISRTNTAWSPSTKVGTPKTL